MSEQNTTSEPGTQNTPGSAGLEVAGEPGVYWCARHRKTHTRLRCGRCETPICPKCTIYGPSGARCQNCASYRGTHLYQVSAANLAATFALSALLGLVGSVLIRATGILLLLFFAPAIGSVLGKAITKITRGKRGPVIASAASLGIAAGTLAVFAQHWMSLQNAMAFPGAPARSLDFITLLNASGGLYLLIFLALAISGVWWWLR